MAKSWFNTRKDRDVDEILSNKSRAQTDLSEHTYELLLDLATEMYGTATAIGMAKASQDAIYDAADDELFIARSIPAVSSRFQFDEIKSLFPDNDKLERAVQEELYKLVRYASSHIAKTLCPVASGAMKASIYVSRPYGTEKQQTRSYNMGVTKAMKLRPSLIGGYSRGVGIRGYKDKRVSAEAFAMNVRKQFRNPLAQKPGERITSEYTRHGKKYRTLTAEIKNVIQQRIFHPYFRAAGEYAFMPFGGRDGSPNALNIEFGVAVYYAGYVEFGHKGYAPHPFFTPAVNYVKANMNSAIQRGVEKVLGKS